MTRRLVLIVVAASMGSGAVPWRALARETTRRARGSGATAGLVCRAAIEDYLDRWESLDQWQREPDGPWGLQVFRTPTKKVGRWLVLHRQTGSRETVHRIDPDFAVLATWDETCELTERPIQSPLARLDRQRGVTDRELRELLRKQETGIVYLWSPHMPYSVQGYREIDQAAQALGLALLVVLHPAADPEYARRVADEASLPPGTLRPLASVELLFRGMAVHAPSVLVFAQGRWAGPLLPGFREAHQYEAFIRDALRK